MAVKKPRYKHEPGEYITLGWDYGTPECLCCHGHIDPAKARAIMDGETDGIYEFSDPEPRWGRCSQRADYEDHHGWVLETYMQPGRGRFPIMEADVIGYANG